MTMDAKQTLIVSGLLGLKVGVLCAILVPAAVTTKIVVGAVAMGGVVGLAGAGFACYQQTRRPNRLA
jgi:uncharacterized membrane protein YebE (DUF533 family)